MKERIVNVFVYGDDEYVRSFGWCTYMAEGSYQALTSFLQSRVDHDFKGAQRHELPRVELRSVFEFAARLDALEHVAPGIAEVVGDSVYCITHIVNGRPQVGDVLRAPPDGTFPDYLSLYWTDSGFDFGQMINDDFMDAVKVLWNSKKYISALKLLVIMIDSLGFAEFGSDEKCLVLWLDKYCDLSSLGVSSQEIWELRNSLVHMTNLNSRRVEKGQVTRLLPVITSPSCDIQVEGESFKSLHFSRLLLWVIPKGLVSWADSFTNNREKFLDFVRRYDTIVSDTRVSVAYIDDEQTVD